MFEKIKAHIKSKIVIVRHEEAPTIKTIRFTGYKQCELKPWSIQNSEIQQLDFSQMYNRCQI